MLVLPLIWRGFSQGLVQGATFGAVRPRLPIPEYQAAAAKWLSDTGRTGCSVSDGYELIDGEWEFSYQCSGIATLPPPRRSGAFPPVTSSGGQR